MSYPTILVLTRGRGEITGDLIHSNPNYTFLVDQSGTERNVRSQAIADVVTPASLQGQKLTEAAVDYLITVALHDSDTKVQLAELARAYGLVLDLGTKDDWYALDFFGYSRANIMDCLHVLAELPVSVEFRESLSRRRTAIRIAGPFFPAGAIPTF